MRWMLSLLMVAFLAACATVAPPLPLQEAAPPIPAPQPRVDLPTAPSPADTILAGLDARALVGQLIVVYRADNAYLLEHGFGGVLLFKSMLGDTAVLRDELARLQARAPIPYLVALDQEGGAVSRLDAVPGWQDGTPGPAEMAGWPLQEVWQEGRRIGRALTGLGVNLNLAPVLDSALAWDGSEGWMGRRRRAFGQTDAEIIPPARAFATGCAAAGVACLAKHFPGYDVVENSDLEPAHSGAPLAAIEQVACRFGAVADVTAGVMMSSIIHRPLGPEPAVLNPTAVAMARGVVGEGLIMTDDLWGTALRAWRRPDLQILPAEYPDGDWLALGEAAVRAGNDLLLITYPAKAALLQRLLADRIDADPTLRAQVTAAARRVLAAKLRLGLIHAPATQQGRPAARGGP